MKFLVVVRCKRVINHNINLSKLNLSGEDINFAKVNYVSNLLFY
jgi:hypothetical protein